MTVIPLKSFQSLLPFAEEIHKRLNDLYAQTCEEKFVQTTTEITHNKVSGKENT